LIGDGDCGEIGNGKCSTHRGDNKCFQILIGKPEWRRLLGRNKPKRKDYYNKIDYRKKELRMGSIGRVW
jgi:hypothetical protein